MRGGLGGVVPLTNARIVALRLSSANHGKEGRAEVRGVTWSLWGGGGKWEKKTARGIGKGAKHGPLGEGHIYVNIIA
jgi:hypothetical protein